MEHIHTHPGAPETSGTPTQPDNMAPPAPAAAAMADMVAAMASLSGHLRWTRPEGTNIQIASPTSRAPNSWPISWASC